MKDSQSIVSTKKKPVEQSIDSTKQQPVEPEQPSPGPIRSWVQFWFTPVDPVGLHVVCVLAGLLFIVWLLPFAGHLEGLFGLEGWFDQQAYREAAQLPDGPPKPISWSILYLCGSSGTLLTIAYGLSLGVLVLFTLGLWTRVTAVLTWLIVASFTATPAIDYEGDVWLLLLAFYLMVGYVLLGQRIWGQSLAARLLGSRETWLLRRPGATAPEASVGANVALRLLQVHLAIVLVTTGLHKLQFGDWWFGVAFWYELFPPFKTRLADVLTHASERELLLGVLSTAAYATLAWQIAFPVFAWRRRWRLLLLGGAVLGWLGTAFLYRLPLVGPALFIACLSYLSPVEWRRSIGWLVRRSGVRWLPQRLAVPSTDLVTLEQR